MFDPVSPKVDVNELETAQLAFWKEAGIFQRTMKDRRGGQPYVFYEGPPTANGRPGSHHVLSRAFKDIFPRYKTMNGYFVLRKGGWDTHGLPVEIEVEKQLGFNHKHEIEAYGIAEFNRRCRESVLKYIREWEELTERIAFWVDIDKAYFTFTNDYVQSVWWILRQFWDKGLLFQGHKVVPYCPRCGTPLSSHEVNLGYKRNTPDPSFYVRFKLVDEDNSYFLVWTTTPWTLPGNVALAVGESIEYLLLEGQNEAGQPERLYVAAALLDPATIKSAPQKAAATDEDEDEGAETEEISEDDARFRVYERLKQYQVVARLPGKDLVGRHYEPLFRFLPVEQDYAYVVAGDFVSTHDGTGIVHLAPAFGADDMEMGRKHNLPTLMTVAEDGTFIPEVTHFAGMWVKDADQAISDELGERGLRFHHGIYTHSYPFCWRCSTPLLYYARPTWYIRTSSQREALVGLNKTINWVPFHVRDGRFGKWLEGNIDWALGRERYWGTPLPVWLCNNPNCDHRECVGGADELSEKAGRDLSSLDLHRPYVDEVTWPCRSCEGGTMRRVPELIDVWFDSGAMPVAQWGYPYHNQDMFETQYPADYICEAVDQTRGWFYSLHAISALLNNSVAFKNVICLGHILDEKGQKMSKSKGNVVEPWPVIKEYGADAFRWYMYTAGPPGEPRRFSIKLVGQSYSSFWSTLWNTYSFFVTYANLDQFDPGQAEVRMADRSALDRWVLAELHALTRTVTEAYESYDVTNATRPIEQFVDDLSNWYLRRSRRRFWKSENDTDKLSAYLTLYECLTTLSKLLAPAMPFLSEAIYRNLVASINPSAPASVHLSDWPGADHTLIDEGLMDGMRLVMRLVRLGHAARNSAGIKVRQPLASAAYSIPGADGAFMEHYGPLIADELNVKSVEILAGDARLIEHTLNPIPRLLGKRLGDKFPPVQKLLREGNPEETARYARSLLAGESIAVMHDGEAIHLTPEEVEVRSSPLEGYAVVEEGGYLVALNITLDEALRHEGLARDVIRRIQTMRRDADFKVDDRIVTTYQASGGLARAIEQFAELICDETLSETLALTDSPTGEKVESFDLEDETITLGLRRREAG